MTDGRELPLLRVEPAGPQHWDDVAAVFDAPGDQRSCWCAWFRFRNAVFQSMTPQQRRDDLHARVVHGSPPPGVLARLDGEPVGWCATSPRTSQARLATATTLRAAGVNGDLADPAIWAVTCFVVRRWARGRGVTAALLDGALSLAREHGARIVEAYPVDPQGGRVPVGDLYHGNVSTFLAAGFTEVGRASARRPVVRLELDRLTDKQETHSGPRVHDQPPRA
jgi:predicted GNAT family acetyltransferase